MAQTILGLDMGAHAVKAVLLSSAYRGFEVLDHAAAPLEPAEEGGPALRERQAAALGRLLADRGWRPDLCLVTTPGVSVAAHVVSLPFTDPRRIEQTIGFEVEGQIPYELADAAWDWQLLGERAGTADLWVGVAPRAELTALLESLSGAGLDPRVVAPPAPTLGALFVSGLLGGAPLAGAEGQPAPAEALFDLGEERAILCLGSGGRLEAARTVAWGAGPLIRLLAAELGVPEGDMRRVLQARAGGAPLDGPGDEALLALAQDPRSAAAIERALAPLMRELRATVRAWRARVGPRPLGRMWLAGGLARLPALPALFAGEVDGPILPLELAGPAAAGLPAETAPAFALALATAVRGHLGARASRINLCRGDAAYTRDLEALRGKVATLGVAVGLVLLLAVASTGVKVFALSRQEQALDKVLCDAQTRILNKCFANHEEAISVLKGRGVPGAAIPKGSAVEVLGELAARVPDGVALRLDRIDVTEKKLHLQGTTDTAENVDRIVGGLHGSRCFADARPQGVRKRGSDSKFEFSVDSALACSGPAQGEE